jgi:hypothetical protein
LGQKHQLLEILEDQLFEAEKGMFEQDSQILASTKLSEVSFSKIWNNPEDSEYDNL